MTPATSAYSPSRKAHLSFVLRSRGLCLALLVAALLADPGAGAQTVLATVTAAGDSVTFYDGSTAIGTGTLNAQGVAMLTTTTLPVGANIITANFPQQGSFSASTSSPVTVTVTAVNIATTTVLTASTYTVPIGGSITLTARVHDNTGNGIPTGTVTFTADGVNLGSAQLVSGVATLNIAHVPADAPKTVQGVATYNGDANSLASTSSPITVTVTPVAKIATTTTLTASSKVVRGDRVLLRVIVRAASGKPSGRVTFTANGEQIGSVRLKDQVVTLSTEDLPAGTNNIVASYAQHESFAASTSSVVAVTVTKASTATELTSSASTVAVGASIRLTARVHRLSGSEVPTGRVTFLADGVNLGSAQLISGVATLNIPHVPADAPRTVRAWANYGGDTNSLASTSSPITVTVRNRNKKHAIADLQIL